MDAGPPVFNLSFEVENRPPTFVTCNVDGVIFNISDEDLTREVLISTDPISVRVTVTVRTGKGGIYQCKVYNDAPNGNTSTNKPITVIGKH